MSKKPQSRTAEGHKRATTSREQLLNDIRSIRKSFPNAVITRDFYRQQGKFADKAISLYFPKFSDLVKEAGCEPPKPTSTVEAAQEMPVADKLTLEREKLAVKKENASKLLDEALHKINTLEQERDAILGLTNRTPQIISIASGTKGTESESVAVLVASDWHIEENVDPAQVGYKNTFNLEIAESRVTKFFQGGLRLFDILKRDTSIRHVILALLGDFITNTIHEDFQETNNLLPAEAIYRAEGLIISGIKFLLEQLPKDVDLLVIAHSGNHARTTKKQRGSSEFGNSLETFMYYHIRDTFNGEPRIKFQISEGYHTHTRLFEDRFTVRWSHGHAIKSAGGVGGIYPVMLRSIAQWNKAQWADLDVMGHFHQFHDHNSFIINGSLIGYNDFAVRIRADYEKPKQVFFLINRRWLSKTMVTPIFLE